LIPEQDFIRIGVVSGVHGLHGRLKVYITTDIKERFSKGTRIFINEDGTIREYAILEYADYKERTGLLKLEGIDDVERARRYRGFDILIEKTTAVEYRDKLDPDEFIFADIIGCDAYVNDEKFGKVTDIIQTGAADILVISAGQGKEFLLPFVDSMTDTKHILSGRIDIFPIEGLFDI